MGQQGTLSSHQKPNTREVIIMRKYYLNKLKSTCSKLEREALRTLIELCNWCY
ncbi:hypothetical protein VCR31J2_100080 [Vibrio coralliirubri]|uniref:Uncharacterized protein n=1 Tax=Vibrio coralliirubri TaxID=1516159 RepID=A0AA86XJ34_9VIBR|nr:hypothetical protein VCR31J2_100080 [Vibrio coralliirubri]